MIYYQDQDILIRNMQASDAPIITEEEIAQGWHQTVEKYEMRLRDQAEGKCIIDLAWFQFHYRINGNGEVEFDYPEEIQLNEYDTPLKDIQIDRVSPDIIVIQAKTSFYDAGKDYSLGGRLVLVYKRNRTEVN